MTNAMEMAKLAQLVRGAQQALGQNDADYATLASAIQQAGFNGSLYIMQGSQADALEAQGQKAPAVFFWVNEQGTTILQCAKADGTSVLFYPGDAEDVESQLAGLAQRGYTRQGSVENIGQQASGGDDAGQIVQPQGRPAQPQNFRG